MELSSNFSNPTFRRTAAFILGTALALATDIAGQKPSTEFAVHWKPLTEESFDLTRVSNYHPNASLAELKVMTGINGQIRYTPYSGEILLSPSFLMKQMAEELD
jgi:hypothetical protein